jgi:hypothetical protein
MFKRGAACAGAPKLNPDILKIKEIINKLLTFHPVQFNPGVPLPLSQVSTRTAY